MRTKVVHNREAFEQMIEVYHRRGHLVVQTSPNKVETFDEKGVKKNELVYKPQEVSD